MNNEPIVKATLKALDCDLRHDGLDLRLKREESNSSPLNRGPNSFEIVNQGRGFGDESFPTKAIARLLDDVIIKYFESKGSVKNTVENLNQAAAASLVELHIKDGKYLSKIVQTDNECQFHTIDKSKETEEMKQITADLWCLLAVAKSGIEDKTMQVNDKMKIGTIDSDKRTKNLGIWTTEGFVPYTKDTVPKKLLLTSLWYALRLHQSSKLFLEHINLEVSYKGYKAKITRGEVHLVTEGLSELTIDLYTDLRRIEQP